MHPPASDFIAFYIHLAWVWASLELVFIYRNLLTITKAWTILGNVIVVLVIRSGEVFP